MTTAELEALCEAHGITRLVRTDDQQFSDFTVAGGWHAWTDVLAEGCGIGFTIEEAVHDAIARQTKAAA